MTEKLPRMPIQSVMHRAVEMGIQDQWIDRLSLIDEEVHDDSCHAARGVLETASIDDLARYPSAECCLRTIDDLPVQVHRICGRGFLADAETICAVTARVLALGKVETLEEALEALHLASYPVRFVEKGSLSNPDRNWTVGLTREELDTWQERERTARGVLAGAEAELLAVVRAEIENAWQHAWQHEGVLCARIAAPAILRMRHRAKGRLSRALLSLYGQYGTHPIPQEVWVLWGMDGLLEIAGRLQAAAVLVPDREVGEVLACLVHDEAGSCRELSYSRMVELAGTAETLLGHPGGERTRVLFATGA